jgi:cytochrome c553
LAGTLLSLIISANIASASSCVNCHGNEGVMKALYKPPEKSHEGEGEG